MTIEPNSGRVEAPARELSPLAELVAMWFKRLGRAIKTLRLDIPRTSPQYKSFIDRFYHEAMALMDQFFARASSPPVLSSDSPQRPAAPYLRPISEQEE